MVSDILLVLAPEHRDLLELADRCGRVHRGMASPERELHRRLRAHLGAGGEAVYPVLPPTSQEAQQLRQALATIQSEMDQPGGSMDLARAATVLVLAERALVLPSLEERPIEDRRRRGKAFRSQRDALLRATPPRIRRQRSQTELYEVARRAGIPNRSRMTQAQLQDAVSEWEHQPHGPGR